MPNCLPLRWLTLSLSITFMTLWSYPSFLMAQNLLDQEGNFLFTPEEWAIVADDEKVVPFFREKIKPLVQAAGDNGQRIMQTWTDIRLSARAWKHYRREMQTSGGEKFPSLSECTSSNPQEMRKIKEQVQQFFYPILLNELKIDDYDLLFLIVGAGKNPSHRRPKMVDEAALAGKKVKILNLDSAVEFESSFHQPEGVDSITFPLPLPGNDGSGFAPRVDEKVKAKIWKLIEGNTASAKAKNKHVILLWTAYYYPIDGMIELWERYKADGHVHLILSYEDIPTVIFDKKSRPFPSYESMTKFNRFFHRQGKEKDVAEKKFKRMGQFFETLDNVSLSHLGIY